MLELILVLIIALLLLSRLLDSVDSVPCYDAEAERLFDYLGINSIEDLLDHYQQGRITDEEYEHYREYL